MKEPQWWSLAVDLVVPEELSLEQLVDVIVPCECVCHQLEHPGVCLLVSSVEASVALLPLISQPLRCHSDYTMVPCLAPSEEVLLQALVFLLALELSLESAFLAPEVPLEALLQEACEGCNLVVDAQD